MFAGDSSFGEDSMDMMEIMMLSTCAGRTLRLQRYIDGAETLTPNEHYFSRQGQEREPYRLDRGPSF